MKMAKASKEEWEKVMRFSNELEEKSLDYAVSDKDLGAWVRKSTPPMRRVVFGYQVLVDNCADPDLDYLEFNPRIKAALEAAPATVAAAGTTAAPKEDACKTGAGS